MQSLPSLEGPQALKQGSLSHDLSFLLPNNLTYSNPITDSVPTAPADSPKAASKEVTPTPLPVSSSRTGNLGVTASSLSNDLSFLLPKTYLDLSTPYVPPSSADSSDTTGTPQPRSSTHTGEPAISQPSPSHDLSVLLPSKQQSDDSSNSAPHSSAELTSILPTTTGLTDTPIVIPLTPQLNVPPLTSQSHDISIPLPQNHDNPTTDPNPPTPATTSRPQSLEPKPPATFAPSIAANDYSGARADSNNQDDERTAGAGSYSCESETETEADNDRKRQNESKHNLHDSVTGSSHSPRKTATNPPTTKKQILHVPVHPRDRAKTRVSTFSLPAAKSRRSPRQGKIQLDEADVITLPPSPQPRKYLGMFGKRRCGTATAHASALREWDKDECGDGEGDSSEAPESEEEEDSLAERKERGVESKVGNGRRGRDSDRRTRSSFRSLSVRRSDRVGKRKGVERVEDEGEDEEGGCGEGEGISTARHIRLEPAGVEEEGPRRIVSHVLIPARRDS